jgi:putative hemolysin
MKWTLMGCLALITGCANTPPPDNHSLPGAGQPAVDERREARALEQAESNCASQGKHAVASRVDGDTIYTCVDSATKQP